MRSPKPSQAFPRRAARITAVDIVGQPEGIIDFLPAMPHLARQISAEFSDGPEHKFTMLPLEPPARSSQPVLQFKFHLSLHLAKVAQGQRLIWFNLFGFSLDPRTGRVHGSGSETSDTIAVPIDLVDPEALLFDSPLAPELTCRIRELRRLFEHHPAINRVPWESRVLAIDDGGAWSTIGAGAEDGLRVGDLLEIHGSAPGQPGEYKATVQIYKLVPSKALCRVYAPAGPPCAPLQVGDPVVIRHLEDPQRQTENKARRRSRVKVTV